MKSNRMREVQSKSNYHLLFIIVVIVSMVNELSLIGLMLWAIGISLTCTLLDRKGMGVSAMNHIKRRILLGIGMTLTIISLLDEVSNVSLGFFAVGFILTVMSIENSNKINE